MIDQTALQQLRSATRAQHATLDAMFSEGIGAPADYARYLRGMEHAVGMCAAADAHLARIYGATLRHLHADLQTLRLPVLDACAPCVAVDFDKSALTFSNAQRLGVRYVIDGSSMGARLLIRHVQLSGWTSRQGASFLAYHLRRGSAVWPRLRARLDRLQTDHVAMHAMIESAQVTFATFAHSFAQVSQANPEK